MAEACEGPAAQHGRLQAAARPLLDAFRNACDDATHAIPSLDLTDRPMPNAVRQLNVRARMMYCFTLGYLVGSPGSRELAERGVGLLLDRHRDVRYGCYYLAVAPDGVRDSSKRCYEHAFVLLAAAATRIAGIDRARALFDDAAQIIDERSWAEGEGRYREDSTEDWQPRSPYRGQNSNMHMTEALLATDDATGDRLFLSRALSVAERLIRGSAARNGWRTPKHYDPSWRARPDYHRDRPFDPYRPYRTTPGSSWERARLLIQLRNALPRASVWCPPAATKLYAQAFAYVWDLANGHPSYTVDECGAPVIADVVWWPVAEAIGASAMLARATDDDQYTDDYTRLWAYAGRCLSTIGVASGFPCMSRMAKTMRVHGVSLICTTRCRLTCSPSARRRQAWSGECVPGDARSISRTADGSAVQRAWPHPTRSSGYASNRSGGML